MTANIQTRVMWLITLAIFFGIFFAFHSRAFAYHENCFLWSLGSGCHPHDPPPPPPPPPTPTPTLRASCDGKRPPRTYKHYSRPNCTNVNDLKRGELITVEGSYFPPNAFIHTSFLKNPRTGINHAVTWGPFTGRDDAPKNDEYRTNGNGSFTLVIGLPDYQNIRAYNETVPPGIYSLRVGAVDVSPVGVDVSIGVTSAPPEPQPEPPKPPATPPAREVKRIQLTLNSIAISQPESVLVKKGTVIQGYPFTITLSGFHKSNNKESPTTYDLFIDNTLVKKDEKVRWLDPSKEVAFTAEYSAQLPIGMHTLRVACTNCPFPASDTHVSDRDGHTYAYALGFDVVHEGNFNFEVVVPPPDEEIILPDQEEIVVGESMTISGRNFVPGTSLPSISIVSLESGENIVIDAKNKNATIQADATFSAAYEIPDFAARIVRGEGLVKIVGLSWRFNQLRTKVRTPENSYMLRAPCTLAGDAKIVAGNGTIIDVAQGPTLYFQAKNFSCHDPLTVTARLLGVEGKPAFRIGDSSRGLQDFPAVRNLDYLGTASVPLWQEGNVPQRARGLELQFTDAHERSATIVLTIQHPYSFVIDPVRVKAGSTFFIQKWHGFANNTKVTVSFDGERVKSVYLDPKDPPEITVPKGTANGIHIVELSNTLLFGLMGGKAEQDIEVYDGVGEKRETEDKKAKAEGENTEADKGKGVFGRIFDGIKTRLFGDEQAKSYGETTMDSKKSDEATQKYGDQETNKYGDVESGKYGDVETKTYKDERASNFGDIETKKYGGVETKTYGDTSTKQYGDIKTKQYGDVETKVYGDVKASSYGDVETKAYGDVETKIYGDVKTKQYGDVETKLYGDVKAPSFEAPTTTPTGCNSNIPSYSQPPECRPTSRINAENSYASVFQAFKNFLARVFKTNPKQQAESTEADTSSEVAGEETDMLFPVPAKKQALVPPPKKAKETSMPVSKKTAPAPIQPEKSATPIAKTPRSDLAGSYRCFSYNVSGGGGGNCRIAPPIVLKADGTYSASSETGTYHADGDVITLSESKLRGPGKLLEGNMQIRFEYDYNGWHHTITYLREENVTPLAERATPTSAMLEITLRIAFPEGDRSADSVNTVTLLPQEGGEQVAQALAYPLDRSTIEVWFSKRPPKEGIPSGKVYKVMVGSGFGDWQVGELDLRNAEDGSTITISASAL